MPDSLLHRFQVRWGDLDSNGHMANTAYLDAAADVRMMTFEAGGFPMREFERLRLGPVVFKDEVAYFKELRLLEPYHVGLQLAGLSGDAKHFRLRNPFTREDGAPAAVVTSTGAWLDLQARRLTAPPEALARLLRELPRSEDFEELG